MLADGDKNTGGTGNRADLESMSILNVVSHVERQVSFAFASKT